MILVVYNKCCRNARILSIISFLLLCTWNIVFHERAVFLCLCKIRGNGNDTAMTDGIRNRLKEVRAQEKQHDINTNTYKLGRVRF